MNDESNVLTGAPKTKQSDHNAWLGSLGLLFDPFTYWEASGDPRLSEYTIGHDLFGIAWEEAPAVVFAPAGGGKTTMRAYTIRTCWSGWAGPYILPIALNFGDWTKTGADTNSEANFLALNRGAVVSLLVGFAYRPDRFLELASADQRSLAGFLHAYLPRPLPHYLSILDDTGSPSVLARSLDRSYLLPDEPSTALRQRFIAALFAAATEATPITPAPQEQQFECLHAFLLGPLAFRSVFVLVDGLDARPEREGEERALAWFTGLLQHMQIWANKSVYLKGFVPAEAAAALTQRSAVLLSPIRQAFLHWTPALLAEVLRRRVYVASRGEFDSLDAASTPDVRGLEATLVRAATPLPREAVTLAHRVLREYHARSDGLGRIQPEDIEAALSWYRLRQWKTDRTMSN